MRQRSAAINVRVTPSEKRKMERAALNCQLTLSAYLRKLGLGKTIQTVSPAGLYSLYRQITQLRDHWKTQPEALTDQDFEVLLSDFLRLYSEMNGSSEKGSAS